MRKYSLMRKNEKGEILPYFEFTSDFLFSEMMRYRPAKVNLTSGKPAWKVCEDIYFSASYGYDLYLYTGDYIVIN